MTDELEVVLVQAASGLDPDENRARLVDLVPGDADLVVLPEAWARDFGKPDSPLGEYAESVDPPGPFVTALAEVAADRGTTVVAGMFEQGPDPDRPYNTLVVRGAVEASYRKIHLYDSFGYRESDRMSAGPTEPVVLDLGGFTIGLMTCYDLRFPEMARMLVDAGAEVLLVPAAWMAGPGKVAHWQTLVRARAIENTVHVVAVGQPGPRYCGHSLVVGPLGETLAEGGEAEEQVRATLRRADLEQARERNPSLANRRLGGHGR